MDIDRFLADKEVAWEQLAALSGRGGRRPRRLNEGEIEAFVQHYQRASVDLSQARSHHADPALLRKLSRAVGAGRVLLEGRKPFSGATVSRFFLVAFPTAVWQLRRFVAVALVATFLPAAAMALWLANSDQARTAVGPEEFRAAYVQDEFEAYYSDRPALQFAAEVTFNNIRVSVLAVASGMLVGLGSLFVLVYNGANVGLATGMFIEADQQGRFYGLLLPHGLLELSAIVLAGAAGLALGWAMIVPGDRTRGAAVRAASQRGLTVMLGVAAALVVAGAIEGFVTGSTLATAMRVGLGGSVEVVFLAYLYVFGRRGAAATEASLSPATWPNP
ncbi:MAG: stage II sporulation protein M [Acidimicrobiales bacterium]